MKSPNTSIVFAVQPGHAQRFMFDERTIFANEECRAQTVAGPLGEFVYAEGRYEFKVLLDRIILGCVGQDILPGSLVAAADEAIRQLEAHGETGVVASVGFNLERVVVATD